MSKSSSPSQRILGGILTRKERWGLSGRGWVLLVALCAVASFTFVAGIYPFLAVTQRIETKTMVVEGWIHESAIRKAVQEYKLGDYQIVFSTGGPVQGNGGYTNVYSTAASIGAGRLRTAGIPPEQVQMVPSRVADKDRTYHSAVALREWLRTNAPNVSGINIVTEDVHARRTRLLFEKALGDSVQVGIISIPNPDYDAAHWWRFSEGVRETLGESIAYIYARFIFRKPS